MISTMTPYFKALANKSNRGNMDLLLAEYYFSLNQWSKAQHHIDRCLAKGGLDDDQKAQMLHRKIRQCLHGYTEYGQRV